MCLRRIVLHDQQLSDSSLIESLHTSYCSCQVLNTVSSHSDAFRDKRSTIVTPCRLVVSDV